METRSYQVTPDKLQAIASKLKEHGFDFDPNQPTGSGQAKGFHLQWQVKPGAIDITVLQHPFGGLGIFWRQVENELGHATPV